MCRRSTSTILVVDDNPDLTVLLRVSLEQDGHSVEDVSSGLQALKILQEQENRFSLVLLDLNLPVFDGVAVLEQIREFSNIPIIVVTGRESDQVRCLEMGADDYIVKPFSPADLAARVRAVLLRSRR